LPPLLLAVAAIAVYAAAARRRPVPSVRVAAFAAGVAAAGALIAWDAGSLTAHMLQHGLLTTLAAPLIVLGRPVALALRLAAAPRRQALYDLGQRLQRLFDPWTALSLFVAAQWLAHWPSVLDAAEVRPWLHIGLHLLLLDTAILFFLPVLGRQPVPRRLTGVRAVAHLAIAIPLIDLICVPYVASGRGDAAAAMLAAMSPLALISVAVGWRELVGEEREMLRREALS
jgi:putative copper resistance protein D